MATSNDDRSAEPTGDDPGRTDLDTELAALQDEVAHLRGRLADGPRRVHTLEERLLETKGQLAAAVGQNEKLSYTLREARDHIATLRDEVDKLSHPPSAYGVVVGKNDDDTVDILTSGRKMRVALHPDIDPTRGVLIHLPATGGCQLFELDLRIGWEAAQLATKVREFRSLKADQIAKLFTS